MLRGDTQLTYAVIGKAMEVHNELGPGLQEWFYHEILSEKLRAAEVPHRSKCGGRLIHRGVQADEFEADLLFDERLVVEAKVLEKAFAPDHFTQIMCYQKFWSIPVGLLFDFGKEKLVFQRVVFERDSPPFIPQEDFVESSPSYVSQHGILIDLWERLARVYHYGLGYRDTTYRGLISADLAADGVEHRVRPMARVCCDNKSYGESQLHCMAIDGTYAIMALALQENIRAMDRAIMQTYLRLLKLRWGVIVNFGKKHFQHKFVQQPRD